jgi:hypothetical protein
VTALFDSFCIMLVACACLIRCPASVTNTSDSFIISVPFTLTTRALNSFIRSVILLRALSSSLLFSVMYWSNCRLICLSNVALYLALALLRSSCVYQVNQQSSFLQIKQLFGCDWLLRFVRLYCGRLNWPLIGRLYWS